jgi:hypothetical protein
MHFKCWNVTIEIKMLKNESVVDRNLEKTSWNGLEIRRGRLGTFLFIKSNQHTLKENILYSLSDVYLA